MIRRPPRSTQSRSSAASDVYKRQTGDRLPLLVDLGDNRRFDVVGAARFQHSMARHDTDAVPGNLARMDEIPAHPWRALDDRDDLDAGLHEMVADDEADDARADHQDLVAGLD